MIYIGLNPPALSILNVKPRKHFFFKISAKGFKIGIFTEIQPDGIGKPQPDTGKGFGQHKPVP